MADRIREAMQDYAAGEGARSNRVKALRGSRAKRLRVGDFRVVFVEANAEIFVVKLGPRGDVYD